MNSEHCVILDCISPIKSMGLCDKHYARLRRTGTTDRQGRVCSIEDCDYKHFSHGYCHDHFDRYKDENLSLKLHNPKECVVDSCSKPHLAQGFCRNHYNQWRKWMEKNENYKDKELANLTN